MTKVNFLGLTDLSVIGNNFMNSCSALEDVDISSSSKLSSIGSNFLCNYAKEIKVTLAEVPFSAFKDPSTAFITNQDVKVDIYAVDEKNYESGLPNISEAGKYRTVDVSVNFNYVIYNNITYILSDEIEPANLSTQIFDLPLKDKTKFQGGSIMIATELMKIGLTKLSLNKLNAKK